MGKIRKNWEKFHFPNNFSATHLIRRGFLLWWEIFHLYLKVDFEEGGGEERGEERRREERRREERVETKENKEKRTKKIKMKKKIHTTCNMQKRKTLLSTIRRITPLELQTKIS